MCADLHRGDGAGGGGVVEIHVNVVGGARGTAIGSVAGVAVHGRGGGAACIAGAVAGSGARRVQDQCGARIAGGAHGDIGETGGIRHFVGGLHGDVIRGTDAQSGDRERLAGAGDAWRGFTARLRGARPIARGDGRGGIADVVTRGRAAVAVVAGTSQSFTITGLSVGTTYYIAM